MWFHEIRPHLCRIPWFCVPPLKDLGFLCRYQHWERKKWRQQASYNSWSNAFDPNEKFEMKVYLRSFYFLGRWKKLAQKSTILTVGKPIDRCGTRQNRTDRYWVHLEYLDLIILVFVYLNLKITFSLSTFFALWAEFFLQVEPDYNRVDIVLFLNDAYI